MVLFLHSWKVAFTKQHGLLLVFRCSGLMPLLQASVNKVNTLKAAVRRDTIKMSSA